MIFYLNEAGGTNEEQRKRREGMKRRSKIKGFERGKWQ